MVRIVGVVHGQEGNPQILPLQMAPQPRRKARAFDRTEPFEFRGTSAGLDAVQDLYTNAIPLITAIEITEIDFKDGSVWSRSSSASCSVAPSPFVLVNASAQ
ncbi:MAG: hypothetical protein M3O02_10595 [Acidobacteriota bacterium]|nr:hypothetical protein [Acidobacteriota bacterium]